MHTQMRESEARRDEMRWVREYNSHFNIDVPWTSDDKEDEDEDDEYEYALNVTTNVEW